MAEAVSRVSRRSEEARIPIPYLDPVESRRLTRSGGFSIFIVFTYNLPRELSRVAFGALPGSPDALETSLSFAGRLLVFFFMATFLRFVSDCNVRLADALVVCEQLDFVTTLPRSLKLRQVQ